MQTLIGHDGSISQPTRFEMNKTAIETTVARVEELQEEVLDEIVELEAYAKEGKRPPLARGYRFKINDKPYVWKKPPIAGREVLVLAGLTPPENYTLRVKLSGHKPRKIALDEEIDLRHPGTEKFRAIRKEQTDGELQGRRDAPLLEADLAFLEAYGHRFDILKDGSIWVILHDFPVPACFTHQRISLAIRIEQGYPLTQLDMLYVFPKLARIDGRMIPQTEVEQQIDGKTFQRWSRHRDGPNQWVPGVDCLETHVFLIEEIFEQEAAR
ncbi:multiubiquitin domain-containing protein [Agrobacterium sp. B1(2019)]|uniref:multiubiquitin domain-containing protein n=1 Tax=Agrobacterium sp. B1(2019) TaxID=2607032 RepID=UPI001658F534|nr:multiubiquitin domain-containing protein [Agrobacterium sp. B1(2019)]